MSSSLKLQQASELLLAALQLAQAERDRALFELARGQRSQQTTQDDAAQEAQAPRLHATSVCGARC